MASFAHEMIRHMVNYFPRYLITRAKYAVKIEPIKYLVNVHAYLSNSSMCRKKQFICGKIALFFFLHKYFSEKIFH